MASKKLLIITVSSVQGAPPTPSEKDAALTRSEARGGAVVPATLSVPVATIVATTLLATVVTLILLGMNAPPTLLNMTAPPTLSGMNAPPTLSGKSVATTYL